jgi:hypothetical protein
MRQNIRAVFGISLMAASPLLAAPFQNLGFEQVNTNHLVEVPIEVVTRSGGFRGPAAELLPYWNLFDGPNLVTEIGYNLQPLGAGYPSIDYATIPGTEGSYVLNLAKVGYTLVQTGEIPQNAKSIRFLTGTDPMVPSSYLDVAINGEPIALNLETIFSGRSYVNGDISAFAGQSVELAFTTKNVTILDNITFVVPEPTESAFLCLGSMMIFLPRLYRKFRKLPLPRPH